MFLPPLTRAILYDRMSADNQGNANMTNLAIKGIIGVKAMAQISHALHHDDDGQAYDVRLSESARSGVIW